MYIPRVARVREGGKERIVRKKAEKKRNKGAIGSLFSGIGSTPWGQICSPGLKPGEDVCSTMSRLPIPQLLGSLGG